MSKVNTDRRRAVALAWKNEKGRVLEGKGTRDWSVKEQREIIATGKAKGYQGHHMKSVDGHNSRAGDPNNIQFLTRKEHLAAHKGNYRNNTNGYYDPATGKMNEFGRGKASVDSKTLSQPLNKSQMQYATKKAETVKSEKQLSAAKKADTYKNSNVSKSKSSSQSKSVKQSSAQSKTLSSQRNSATKSASTSATKSKTLSSQRSAPQSASKGASKGQSSGRNSASTGKGASSGKGASHGR